MHTDSSIKEEKETKYTHFKSHFNLVSSVIASLAPVENSQGEVRFSMCKNGLLGCESHVLTTQ